MRVFGIERHETLDAMALRSHECPNCKSLQTDVIPVAHVESEKPIESEKPKGTSSLAFAEGGLIRDRHAR